MSKLVAFDLDGTLIRSYMEEPRIPYHEVLVLTGRRKKLADLTERGFKIAVISNQAGVAFGYENAVSVEFKWRRARRELGLPLDTPFYVCFAHPDGHVRGDQSNPVWDITRRKPNPAMLYEAMEAAGASQAMTTFVGDMDSDRECAERAGVSYYDAADYFAGDVS